MTREPLPDSFEGFPAVTADRMKEIDRQAEARGVSTLELMERAGAAVAGAALDFLRGLGRESGGACVVCCGRGANGGDGLVAARRLREAGVAVKVFLCPPRKAGPGEPPADYIEPVKVNLEKAKSAGVEVAEAGPESGLKEALAAADVVLDALLGTGSSGKPAGAIHHMIQEMNRSKKPILAVDIPSGLHPDTGYHSGVFVKAAETLTLGLPKRGLLAPHARKDVGRLRVLEIGYPPELLPRRAPGR